MFVAFEAMSTAREEEREAVCRRTYASVAYPANEPVATVTLNVLPSPFVKVKMLSVAEAVVRRDEVEGMSVEEAMSNRLPVPS